MKVKVTKDISLSYGGKFYRKDDEFEIQKQHFDVVKDVLEEVQGDSTEDEETPENTPTEETVKPDEDLTVPEIKEMLNATGKEYSKGSKKDDLLKLLNE